MVAQPTGSRFRTAPVLQGPVEGPDSAAKVLLHILTSRRAIWPDFDMLAEYQKVSFSQYSDVA